MPFAVFLFAEIILRSYTSDSASSSRKRLAFAVEWFFFPGADLSFALGRGKTRCPSYSPEGSPLDRAFPWWSALMGLEATSMAF